MRTHYQNLKVAEDAPAEVIKAAYRALSHQYHPDRRSTPDAVRIMQIINDSYEVLSDPERRARHDESIRQYRARNQPASTPPPLPPQPAYPEVEVRGRMVLSAVVIGIGVCFLIVGFHGQKSSSQARRSSSYAPQAPYGAAALRPPQAPPSAYVRSNLTPYGDVWPAVSAYLPLAPQEAFGGLSSLTVDNTQRTSDVHVKLLSTVPFQPPRIVRECIIKAGASFAFERVTAGQYEVRYRDLASGRLAKSEPFNLSEYDTGNGVSYSVMTLTLYTVQNGNSQQFPLSEKDF